MKSSDGSGGSVQRKRALNVTIRIVFTNIFCVNYVSKLRSYLELLGNFTVLHKRRPHACLPFMLISHADPPCLRPTPALALLHPDPPDLA
jgi:hypothetical protein